MMCRHPNHLLALAALSWALLPVLSSSLAVAGPIVFDFETDIVRGPGPNPPTGSYGTAPGAWSTYVYQPAGFAGGLTAPDGREGTLGITISPNEGANERPPGWGHSYLGIQGMQYGTEAPGAPTGFLPVAGTSIAADLYIPEEWTDGSALRWTSLLIRGDRIGTNYDKIIGFGTFSSNGESAVNTYWSVAGADLAVSSSIQPIIGWNHLEMIFDPTGTSLSYLINGQLLYLDTSIGPDGVRDIKHIALIARNFNDPSVPLNYDPNSSYTAYWDNLTVTVVPEVSSLGLSGAAASAAGALRLRHKRRHGLAFRKSPRPAS